MKLITAIVSKDDAKAVGAQLVQAGFTVTRLSTTGGFLLAGNVTLLIATEDEKVEEVIGVIREYSSQRTEVVPSSASYDGIGIPSVYPLEVTVGGATVMVTHLERFEKL